MVNAGKRSKCCFTCRERRIKCDMQLPHCRRCKLFGHECPGYPESWDVAFRIQNEYAEKKVQTRVKRVKAGRIQQSAIAGVSLSQGVYIAAEVHSWNRFYQDYIVDSGIAAFRVIPTFHTDDSAIHLHEALHAVTMASASRQLRQSGLMVRARSHYGKAIARLNTALDDRVSAAEDSVLMTLFLLSFFETIVPEYFDSVLMDKTFRCHAHFRGTLTLLRLRAERVQNTELDRHVFTFLSHICLMAVFMNYGPGEMKWSALEIFASPWTNYPLLEPILRRAVDFKSHAQTQVTAAANDPSNTELLLLISDGIHLSEDLEATATHIRSCSDANLPSHQPPRAFNNLFEISTKSTKAISRSLYRTVRLCVVELVGNLISTINKADGNKACLANQFNFHERFDILKAIYADISAVLDFNEQNDSEVDRTGIAYRAYGMFWPMVALLFSASAEPAGKAWVQERLRSIGKTTGLGLATWAAENVNTLQPPMAMVDHD